MLRVKNIHIENVNGIRSLELSLGDGIDIICGPNGIGKSTIVESIIGSLIPTNQRLNRNVNTSFGQIDIHFENNDQVNNFTTRIESFAGTAPAYRGYQSIVSKVMYFRPNRLVLYQILNAIQKQEMKTFDQVAGEYQSSGISLEPSKNWLAHRDLYSHYPNGDFTDNNRLNLETGKNIFSVLDSTDSCRCHLT